MPAVKAIPDGYSSITPYLIVRGAARAIEFYKRAFDAKELFRMPMPDGRIGHAELRFGNSLVMLADEMPEMGAKSPELLGGAAVGIAFYVEDCDAIFNRAVAAGAKVERPLADMFYGDRTGVLIDPFGHKWSILTHKEDVSPEEMEKRLAAQKK